MADLCYGCMKDTQGEQVCPHCGFSQGSEQASPFLPLGTKLENDRYTVGKVLDSRPDSAKYIGYDNKTNKVVIIREFLPEKLVERSEGSAVVTVGKGCGKVFNSLKQNFISLGKALMEIDNDSVVKTEGVFQDNNTAYILEEYEEVISFEEYVQRSGGKMEWEVARPLIKPLIEGLICVTNKGINHFAICPENLVVTTEGKVKLANFSIKEIRQKGKNLTAQLCAGCSAFEQYDENGVLDNSTDVYGFCATLFFALTGNLPADAVKRKDDGRLLMSTAVAKKLPPFVISTLAKGLQVNKEDRISSFEELSEQFSATPTVQAMQNEISKTAEVSTTETQEKKHKLSNFQMGVIAMLIGLVVFGGLGYMWYSTYPLDGMFAVNNESTEGVTDSLENMPEDFTYAADSEYFRVPDFIGKTWDEAKAVADESSEYKIFKAIDQEFSDTVPEGKICKQTPDAKMTVARGNDGVSITCTISKGAQYRALPKVENVNKDSVTDSLVKQGFVVNSTLSYSDSIPAGSVISYSGNSKEGDKMEYGSTVTINVSLGKKPEAPTEQVFNYQDATQPPVEVATQQ